MRAKATIECAYNYKELIDIYTNELVVSLPVALFLHASILVSIKCVLVYSLRTMIRMLSRHLEAKKLDAAAKLYSNNCTCIQSKIQRNVAMCRLCVYAM